MEQFEHEPVAPQVRRGHPERRREAEELGREVVGRVDLAFEREPEQLDVETLRAFEVAHALPDMVEHHVVALSRLAHGVILARVAATATMARCGSRSSATWACSRAHGGAPCCATRGSHPPTSARGSRSRATTGWVAA